MFRGSPPHGRLLDMPPDLGTSLLTSRTATLVVGPLHWDPGRENVTRTRVNIYRTVGHYNKNSFPRKKYIDVADLDGRLEEGVWKFPPTQVALNESEKDSLGIRSNLLYLSTYLYHHLYLISMYHCIRAEIWRTVPTCCGLTTRTKRQDHTLLSPTALAPFPAAEETKRFKVTKEIPQFEMKFTEIGSRVGAMLFSIQPGTFYDCVMPETVESMWGPVPLERLPEGVDNTCRAVTHG